MPVPPVPILVGPAAAAAAKAAAVEYLPAISSASLAAVLARMAWKRIPEWIRHDVTFRKSGQTGSLQEMEHLSSVLEKLQSLVATASEKLHQPVPNLYAALLAYFQLAAQLKRLDPVDRNERYERAGENIVLDEEQHGVLCRALDFAIWAYYVSDEDYLEQQLEPTGYTLLQVHAPTKPGSVGHFLALSKSANTVVIGIRGTSSLEDIFTDTCGRSVSYLSHHENGEDAGSRIEVRARIDDEVSAEFGIDGTDGEVEIFSGHEKVMIDNADEEHEHHVRCHEGILISASRLAKHVQPLIKSLVIDGESRLCICGHSLGGGAASLLASILRAKFPILHEDNRLQVYAFAPPPVLDHDTSIAQSSFCTSVVNNSDFITRSSLANLAVFLEVLRTVSHRLKERDLLPNSAAGAKAFLRKLTKGEESDLLLTQSEVSESFRAASEIIQVRHPDHLFIPGKVLLLYKPWPKVVARELEDNAQTKVDSEHECITDPPFFSCLETIATADVLRIFELDGTRMLGDHTTSAYEAALAEIRLLR